MKYYDTIDGLMDFLRIQYDVDALVKDVDGTIIVGITDIVDDFGYVMNDVSSDIDTLEDVCNYCQVGDDYNDFTDYNHFCKVFDFEDGFFFKINVTLI